MSDPSTINSQGFNVIVNGSFPHPVLPTVRGSCDDEKFHIMISFGNLGKNFNIMIGTHDMTPDRKAEYGVKENNTHTSLAVPFLASDVVYEV